MVSPGATYEAVRRVLAEQNPWATLQEVPTALAPPIERRLATSLAHRVQNDAPRRFQLVLGPRRVGKTTVMYQALRHLLGAGLPADRLWWYRLDHPLLLEWTLDDLVRIALDETRADPDHPTILFFDELVYARDWDLWLKTFYDQGYPVKIVATSSATAALRDRRLESGVGRWEEQFLMPYLFTEFLALTGREAEIPLEATLADSVEAYAARGREVPSFERRRKPFALIGGFPELLLAAPQGTEKEDPFSDILASQRVLRTDAIERSVYKDIPQSFGVDNPMALERLLYTLAGQVANLISPTKICGELGIGQPTLDRYIGYLSRAFLIFTLSNYSGSEASVQRRGRKLYFVDGAVRNAALQRGIAPLIDPTEAGLLLENQVASHLHALSLQTQARLFHWRDGRYEVDFVLDHPERPLAIEVGSSADHSRAGLAALMQRYPRFRGRCYLVAPDIQHVPSSKGNEGVGTLPVDLFLILVGLHAEAALNERLTGRSK